MTVLIINTRVKDRTKMEAVDVRLRRAGNERAVYSLLKPGKHKQANEQTFKILQLRIIV